jgi:hypothetical protein
MKVCFLLIIITIATIREAMTTRKEFKNDNDSDVYVTNEDENEDELYNSRKKRDTNSQENILKTYINNLKNVKFLNLFFFEIFKIFKIKFFHKGSRTCFVEWTGFLKWKSLQIRRYSHKKRFKVKFFDFFLF